MAIRISGPGVGLPFPSGVMPTTFGSPWQPPTNRIDLQPGQVLMIPAGNWIVQSIYTVSELQFRDPTDEQWKPLLPATTQYTATPAPWAAQLFSDGINYRVANISQVGTSGGTTTGGSGYVQATTVVTPSAGNSTWRAIIGGNLNITLTSPGAGYSIAPFVSIPAPGPPGHPARAIATLAADGTVASITTLPAGAGYKTPPAVSLIPSPNDPNIDDIVAATAISELSGAGEVTAILLDNFGMPLPAPPTLTISGSGSGASVGIVLPTPWIAPQDDLILLQPAAG